MIIYYLANVFLVPTITRNCKNLFYYDSNTTVDLWWSHQYGRHWLHLCIADALSSPSFKISVCCPHCSQLSTVMNNIVEPESGVTMLNNIVEPESGVTILNNIVEPESGNAEQYC